MMRWAKTLTLAGGLTLAAASVAPASAAPAGLAGAPALATADAALTQVRWICGPYGRCVWRPGPRFYGYYGPRRFYGPGPRFYGPRFYGPPRYYGPRYYRPYW